MLVRILSERRLKAMSEYKMIEPDEIYSPEELRRKYNYAVEDIWYLEYRVKELDSDYEGMLNGFLELLDRLAVYEGKYGILPEAYGLDPEDFDEEQLN